MYNDGIILRIICIFSFTILRRKNIFAHKALAMLQLWKLRNMLHSAIILSLDRRVGTEKVFSRKMVWNLAEILRFCGKKNAVDVGDLFIWGYFDMMYAVLDRLLSASLELNLRY